VSAIRRLRPVASWQITLGVALLALGFLIATQLRTEAPRVRYSSNERVPLVETARDLQSRQDALKQQLLDLRSTIQTVESQGQGSAALVRDLGERLRQARIAAGLTALQGPGLVLQLGDSPNTVPPGGNPTDYLVSARDIRTVVEELWLAGAEAVAVNGERVTAPSAIIDIGGSVLLNAAYLAPPYQVSAIGPPDLFDQVNGSAGFQDFVRMRVAAFGLQVGFAELKDVTIPAYAGTIDLRYARPDVASPGPSASAGP
jgi:uncharacterized protein YlxW (UPF0749 family)